MDERLKDVTRDQVDRISYKIIGAAIEVHKILGPGLLESIYERALIHELTLRGLRTSTQRRMQIMYKGMPLDCELRYDVLVEDLIIVENKSVMDLHPVFMATILSYMEHLKVPKGIIFNFNVTNLTREGQQTFVNRYYEELS